VKCSDIRDEDFIAAVGTAMKRRGFPWATRWDVAAVLDDHPEWVGGPEATDGSVRLPEKLVLAKARKLIRRGLLTGCACGCRGEWEPKRIVPADLLPAVLDPRTLLWPPQSGWRDMGAVADEIPAAFRRVSALPRDVRGAGR